MPGAFGVLGTFRMFAGDQEKLVEVEEPRVPRARLSLQALPKHSSDHVVLLPYGPTLFRIAAMVMKQRKGRSLSGRAHGGVGSPEQRFRSAREESAAWLVTPTTNESACKTSHVLCPPQPRRCRQATAARRRCAPQGGGEGGGRWLGACGTEKNGIQEGNCFLVAATSGVVRCGSSGARGAVTSSDTARTTAQGQRQRQQQQRRQQRTRRGRVRFAPCAVRSLASSSSSSTPPPPPLLLLSIVNI
ncbi:unnamed protein product [Lampetra planeri]